MRFSRRQSGLLAPEREFIPPGVCSIFYDNIRMGASAAAPKVPTFRDSATDVADATTYNGALFQGLDIGAAAASRRVHCLVMGGALNRTVTAASSTIGGVTTTKVVEQVSSGLSYTVCLLVAAVPTGTTADFSITWSAGQQRCSIIWWTSTGLAADAAHDFKSSTASPGVGTNLATLADGFAIAGSVNIETGADSVTWASVTERFDGGTGDPVLIMNVSGADASTTGATISPEVTYSASSSNQAMVAASW